jgi:hypothetical protein
MKDRLRSYVLQHPFKSAKQLRRNIIGWQRISVRSIQHVLQKDPGLPSRVAAKKPLLTLPMVKKHLRVCKSTRSGQRKTGLVSCSLMSQRSGSSTPGEQQ